MYLDKLPGAEVSLKYGDQYSSPRLNTNHILRPRNREENSWNLPNGCLLPQNQTAPIIRNPNLLHDVGHTIHIEKYIPALRMPPRAKILPPPVVSRRSLDLPLEIAPEICP